ncbi:MAG: hypothetical protein ACK51N_00040 [bacterium]|jgi:hypothetical protein|nr:hypothetical protein [Phycisphaerales bacterium]MCE2654026.1 hypothetical protein [Planctomycetaceae bacterium]
MTGTIKRVMSVGVALAALVMAGLTLGGCQQRKTMCEELKIDSWHCTPNIAEIVKPGDLLYIRDGRPIKLPWGLPPDSEFFIECLPTKIANLVGSTSTGVSLGGSAGSIPQFGGVTLPTAELEAAGARRVNLSFSEERQCTLRSKRGWRTIDEALAEAENYVRTLTVVERNRIGDQVRDGAQIWLVMEVLEGKMSYTFTTEESQRLRLEAAMPQVAVRTGLQRSATETTTLVYPQAMAIAYRAIPVGVVKTGLESGPRLEVAPVRGWSAIE